MAVQNYGVVIGQFDHFDRDDEHHYGNYFHGHIFVRTSQSSNSPTMFNCAVDVKYPDGYVQYFMPQKLDLSKFGHLQTLVDGFHALPSLPASGALDYVRDPLLSTPPSHAVSLNATQQVFTHKHHPVWQENVGGSALNDMERFLQQGVRRIYVFGAHYADPHQSPPQGMHDCHMNQGDPPGPFQHLDAIWQDGGVIVERSSGTFAGFLVKFVTQTFNTNNQGLPK